MAGSVRRVLNGVFARGADEQPVLWRDACRNGLRPDAIAALPEAYGAHDVDGCGTVDPPGKIAGVAAGQIVTARQDGNTRALPRPRGPAPDPSGCRTRGRRRRDRPAGFRRPRAGPRRTARGRRASAMPQPVRPGAFPPTGAPSYQRRGHPATSRPEESGSGPAGHDRRPGPRSFRPETAGARAGPSPTPRTVPSAAGSPHDRRHAPRDGKASPRESDPDRDR